MKRPFWTDGIRFECQETGRCCTSRGEYGYIYVNDDDRQRLAAQLNLPVEEFTATYCRTTNGHAHLRNPEADCEFLDGKALAVVDGLTTRDMPNSAHEQALVL